MHRRLMLMLLLALFIIPAVGAQDDLVETTVGPVTITHPESWYILQGPADTLVMAEFDLSAIGEGEDLPEDAVIVQLRLFGLNRVAGIIADDLTAHNIAGGLLANDPDIGDELPEITEIERDNFTFAQVDVSNDQLTSYVYVAILSHVSFGIITVSTTQSAETLDSLEAGLLDMLDTITLNFETPFPQDAFARYTALPYSLTDEGFPRLGNLDAPVTVMEISSFDCSACREFHDAFLPDLLPRIEAGEINLVYVPLYGTGSLPLGDSAARAALCAGSENFWAFHDVLFSWQDFGSFAFSYERLQAGAANMISIPPAEFDTCYTSEKTNAVLEAARQQTFDVLGQEWHTPTVLVNGTLVDSLSPAELHAQINDVLALQSGD